MSTPNPRTFGCREAATGGKLCASYCGNERHCVAVDSAEAQCLKGQRLPSEPCPRCGAERSADECAIPPAEAQPFPFKCGDCGGPLRDDMHCPACNLPGDDGPAVPASVEALVKEAKQFALAIFGDGDARSDLRDLNAAIDRLAAASTPPAEAQPVAWWKHFRGEDTPEVVPGRTFIAEDALSTGWRPLVFGDVATPPASEARATGETISAGSDPATGSDERPRGTADPTALDWLLPGDVAIRIGNEHRVPAGAVQAVARAVAALKVAPVASVESLRVKARAGLNLSPHIRPSERAVLTLSAATAVDTLAGLAATKAAPPVAGAMQFDEAAGKAWVESGPYSMPPDITRKGNQ